jgi:hypothetical protein
MAVMPVVRGAAQAAPGDILTVSTESAAPKTGVEAVVKATAVEDALKKAVREALKPILDAERLDAALTDAIESEVYSRPGDFVLNYRILSEGVITYLTPPPSLSGPQSGAKDEPRGEYYLVRVEASVDAAQLRGVVARISAEKAGPLLPVTITILGVADYRSYGAVIASLERIPALKGVSYGSFYRGRIVLKAHASGGLQQLVERVAVELKEHYMVIPGGRDSIVIRPAIRPGGGVRE